MWKKKNKNKDFWTEHNVTNHLSFESKEESLNYFDWRNTQYIDYEKLLPCSGHDNEVILDYGCGPGNDVVGFNEYSKARKIYGLDISASSLKEAQNRLKLHNNGNIEFIHYNVDQNELPFEDNSIDYIHSSGVLHHVPDINAVLREFYRILKSSGIVRVMIYNYNSIWMHLNVAYRLRIVQKIDSKVSLSEAFKRSTDGKNCPISRCYKPAEFVEIASCNSFKCDLIGAAISLNEMEWLSLHYRALKDFRLQKEHRDFLKALTFDKRKIPYYDDNVAGIDSCYELKKC